MIVCHIITGLQNGGAEALLFRLCTARAPAHYYYVVISLSAEGIYVDRFKKAGIPVYCLDMPGRRLTVSGLITLYRLLAKLKPDVVQTWMYHADLVGGLVSRLCGIRNVIWSIHNANLEPGKNRSTTLIIVRICAMLSRWIPTRIVSCSQAATVLHQQAGYCVNKFMTIPNGYAVDSFAPDRQAGLAVRRSLALPENRPVLGMVARFHPLKDHSNFVQALGLLKQKNITFSCLLVGTGMLEDNKILVALIEKAGIKNDIRLLGPRDDIPAIMSALDIHVLSSVGEAFPNVLAESMACGTPCVTTDVGDAAFILGNTGWVVPSRNSKALAAAIAESIAAMGDTSAWQQRQAMARQRIIDNFSLEKMVAAYQKIWEGMPDSQDQKGMA